MEMHFIYLRVFLLSADRQRITVCINALMLFVRSEIDADANAKYAAYSSSSSSSQFFFASHCPAEYTIR